MDGGMVATCLRAGGAVPEEVCSRCYLLRVERPLDSDNFQLSYAKDRTRRLCSSVEAV
jgi:hypothetical protein